MKKSRGIMCSLVLIVITAFGVYLAKIFFVGDLKTDLDVRSISVNDARIVMEGADTADSALAYKCFTYSKDNGNVYIKARFVLVSSIYRYSNF